MNQQNILDADEYGRKKINFWFIWVIGNALGAAIGWTLGETFGQIASETFGIRYGLFVATLIFEVSVWLPRITISRHFKELNLLGYFEMMIWMTAEFMMCVIADLLPPNNVFWLTSGSGIANVMSATISMLFLIMGLSDSQLMRTTTRKKSSIWWVIKTFVKGLFGFTAITILFFTILTISTEIGKIAQTVSPTIGWTLSGLSFGGGIGAITGLGYIKLISRRDRMPS